MNSRKIAHPLKISIAFLMASVTHLFLPGTSTAQTSPSQNSSSQGSKQDSGDSSKDNKKEPVILTTTERAPLYYTENGKVVGLVPPVLDCVFKKMGQPYEIRVLPWKRAQKEVEEGTADGFFTAKKNKERDRYAKPSDSVFYNVWNWYVNKDIDLKPTDPEFKKNVSIGVLAGTDDAADLEQMGYKVVPLKSAKQVAQMLATKRIGAARMHDTLIEPALREANVSLDNFNISFFGAFPSSVYFGHAFLKKNPDFLWDFDDTLALCYNPLKQAKP